MLLFSTILNIDKSLTKDDFLNLVIEWNQKSPHDDNVIPDLSWDGSYDQKFGNEEVSLEFKEYRNEEIIAVRYVKKLDDGILWNTDYVMNFKEYKMSIMLDRSFTEDAVGIAPSFSTPFFIRLLIEKGYVLADGDLPVSMKAHFIRKDNYQLLLDIVNDIRSYNLPIVYVSKTLSNDTPVDVYKLAYDLKGVAHVLVQEELDLNNILEDLNEDVIEVGGSIGLYFQSDRMNNRTVLYHNGFDSDTIRQGIVKAVVNFTNQQSIDPLYTWDGVLTSLLRDRFESQKSKRTKAERTKEETEELLDSFSNDFDELTEENGRLRSSISDLEQELTYYRNLFNNKQDSDSSFISSGSEKEFFQGEKKEFVLSVLSDSLQNIQDGTRKKHIIQDIIQQNDSENILNHKRDKIKRLLTNYSGLNGKSKQELKQLGFTVTEVGKHYKLTYFDDNRYTITMAKTPSDGRAGKNNVSEINKKLF